MGFKDIFFKEEKKEPVVEKEQVKPVQTVVVGQNTNSVFMDANIQHISGTDYTSQLLTGLRQSSDPTKPDFLKFSDALDTMNGIPLTEVQKYQAIFPTYLSLGVSADSLIASSLKYLALLDKDAEDFNNEVLSSQTKIAQKQQEVEALQTKNVELTKQIQDNTAKIQELNVAINNDNTSVTGEKNAFEIALNNIKINIQQKAEKIKLYLNANNVK